MSRMIGRSHLPVPRVRMREPVAPDDFGEGDSAKAPLLQAVGITKRYGAFLANDSVSIDYSPVKFTLCSARTARQVDAGQGDVRPGPADVRRSALAGRKVVLSGPSQAREARHRHGFQHFSLFENLTVAENVALGLKPTEAFAQMSARLAELSARTMACRSTRAARCGGCRSASASASRSCVR